MDLCEKQSKMRLKESSLPIEVFFKIEFLERFILFEIVLGIIKYKFFSNNEVFNIGLIKISNKFYEETDILILKFI